MKWGAEKFLTQTNHPFSLQSKHLHYFHETCSGEQHSLDLPFLIFTAETRQAMHIVVNKSNSLCISLLRCQFPLSCCFPQTATLKGLLLQSLQSLFVQI